MEVARGVRGREMEGGGGVDKVQETQKERERVEERQTDRQRTDTVKQIMNQNQNIYCPSTGLQGNLSYGAQ